MWCKATLIASLSIAENGSSSNELQSKRSPWSEWWRYTGTQYTLASSTRCAVAHHPPGCTSGFGLQEPASLPWDMWEKRKSRGYHSVNHLLQKLSGPGTHNLHVPVLGTPLSCIMKLCTCTHLFKCAYPISNGKPALEDLLGWPLLSQLVCKPEGYLFSFIV